MKLEWNEDGWDNFVEIMASLTLLMIVGVVIYAHLNR